MIEEIEQRFFEPITPHKYFPTTRNKKFEESRKIIHEWADQMIQKGKDNEGSGKALVSVLLHAKGEDGEVLSDQQIHDECCTFMAAGTADFCFIIFRT
jgi:cytochrome P450